MKPMKKPYVICHMMTAVDGRSDCAMTEQLPGVQEDVGPDRRDLLRIGLVEGHALRVVVVRMDQHGRLGRSHAAARQCEGQQQMAEIRFHAKVYFNG